MRLTFDKERLKRLFREHPFVRDGLISIALAFVWSAGLQIWCKPQEGITWDFFRYMLDVTMRPAQAVVNGIMGLALNVTGLLPTAPGGLEIEELTS